MKEALALLWRDLLCYFTGRCPVDPWRQRMTEERDAAREEAEKLQKLNKPDNPVEAVWLGKGRG